MAPVFYEEWGEIQTANDIDAGLAFRQRLSRLIRPQCPSWCRRFARQSPELMSASANVAAKEMERGFITPA